MVASRHIRRGTIEVRWVPIADGIADHDAPTVAELEAGTDISQVVAGIDGFALARQPIPVPTGDTYGGVLSVPGPLAPLGVPTLTVYDEGTATAALRTALADGAMGFVVFCLDGAPEASGRAEVWPVISLGPRSAISGAVEAATFQVSFAVWGMPQDGAVIA